VSALDFNTLIQPQREAFTKIAAFLEHPTQRFFRLAGYAGTGKTYLLGCVNEKYSYKAQINSAPTNKATKVFSKKVPNGSCKTIYSVLGVRMVADEDRLVLEFPHKPVDMNRWDIVYIDEGSMLCVDMVTYIEYISKLYPQVKWVYSADRAQLNPIGEDESLIWKRKMPSVELTEVVRYDNQILNLATNIREQIIHYPDWQLDIRSRHKYKEGVWRVKQRDFLHYLEKASKQGLFNEIDHTKALAWRNATVNQLNDTIRGHTFGRHAYNEPWIVGDRVMVAEPVTGDKGIKANIDDEGSIKSVVVTHNTYYKDLKCYNIVIQLDDNEGELEVSVIHESSASDLAKQLNELAGVAKQDRTKWKFFWALKNNFHKIRHSYGLTAHRGQGSTFRNVFIDMGDIMSNRDKLEALRCLYVCGTRPTTGIIIM
jgi:exodeoxyribonuclease-5